MFHMIIHTSQPKLSKKRVVVYVKCLVGNYNKEKHCMWCVKLGSCYLDPNLVCVAKVCLRVGIEFDLDLS